jgi:hypothetical protein
MNLEKMLRSLERFGHMLPEVVREVSDDDSRWKPPNGAWSIVEVVCHLGDEEEFDFGQRVRLTLTDANTTWPPIDPEGWAIERHYNQSSLDDAVRRFVQLRNESVQWLRAESDPDWNATHEHPKFGPFRAGDILAAWVAHDYLHLRQISKRLFEMAVRDAGEYSIRYAGDWTA